MQQEIITRSLSIPDQTELEQNARLAQDIVMLLRTEQQRSGEWPGRDLGHALRYTCHALEALHLLEGRAFPRAVRNGCHWLLNLPDEIDEGSSAWVNVRLHPSRFKTLAKLGEFNDEKLLEDFVELCGRVGNDGLLNRVLEDQLLGSMIVVDCLLELGDHAKSFSFFERVMHATLPAIESGLRKWCGSDVTMQGSGLVDNVGEASYAMDLLLRCNYIDLTNPLCATVRQAMLDALAYDRNVRMLEKDALYSAIQLSLYYADAPFVTDAIRQFHRHLRMRFQQGDVQRWIKQEDVQPLILRTLLTCGREKIVDCLITNLWEDVYTSQQQIDQEKRSERNRRFEQIIRHRTKIDIRNVQELTGGITTAKVFRVEYVISEDVMLDSSHMRGNNGARIVIKTDERGALEQSIERYKSLPVAIQHYFARHVLTPEVLEPIVFAPVSMVLEDLTEEYVTFREILNEVDKRRPSPDDKDRLLLATAAITRSLFDIYTKTRRPGDDAAGFQTSRLYHSRLDRSLLDMTAHNHFPRLKDFFQGFTLINVSGGEEHFKSIGYYQQAIYRHLGRLRPPCLVMMHGDCHSRNIMIDNCYERVKFIDLDKIDLYGDYILDIALLIEDVALFRRFFDDKYRFFLRPEDIDLEADRTRIAYPTRVTETAMLFQQALLDQVAEFAQRCGDSHYRERLWFATALHLLRLVEKQVDLRMGAALYVEAIRLLDMLVGHWNDHRPLPQVPISPHATRSKMVAEHLQILHAVIAGVNIRDSRNVTYDLRANGAVIRYFVSDVEPPFAIMDGKSSSTRLLLACPPEVLWSVGAEAQAINEGMFQSVIVLDLASQEVGKLVEAVTEVALRHVLPNNNPAHQDD